MVTTGPVFEMWVEESPLPDHVIAGTGNRLRQYSLYTCNTSPSRATIL